MDEDEPLSIVNNVEEANLKRAVAEFTGAFEVVFDRDWAYSQEHMHYEMGNIVKSGGTFLHPGNDPTHVNWGARAALLQAYERLLTSMQEAAIEPELPVRDAWFNYDWPDKSE